jgi:glutathione peroxidase
MRRVSIMSESKFFDFQVKDITGNMVSLDAYRGKTILVVNVASRCGYTPQYKGLEQLYQKFKDKGFVVLAFPCNQFGGQEPGTEADIVKFCSKDYGVTFPMFAKVDVNGAHAAPVFNFLKSAAPGILGTEGIKWNFTKFLVDSSGQVIKRYAPKDDPEVIARDLPAIVG